MDAQRSHLITSLFVLSFLENEGVSSQIIDKLSQELSEKGVFSSTITKDGSLKWADYPELKSQVPIPTQPILEDLISDKVLKTEEYDLLKQEKEKLVKTIQEKHEIFDIGKRRSKLTKRAALKKLRSSFENFPPEIFTHYFGKLKTFFGHQKKDIDPEDPINGSPVYNLTYDKSGQKVITAADDGLIKIWSTVNGELVNTLIGHTSDINAVSLSECGNHLASCSNDGLVRVWHLETGFPIAVFNDHQGTICSLNFFNIPTRGRYFEAYRRGLASASDDGTIMIYFESDYILNGGVKQHQQKKMKLKADETVKGFCSIEIHPEGFILAGTSGGSIVIWNRLLEIDPKRIDRHRIIKREHSKDCHLTVWSKDGTRMISASFDGTAKIWPWNPDDFDSNRDMRPMFVLEAEIEERGGETKCCAVNWSCNGRYVMASFCKILAGSNEDNEIIKANIQVFDSKLNKRIQKFESSYDGRNFENYTFILEPHPFNESIFISADYDGKICLWDIEHGQMLNYFVEDCAHVGYALTTAPVLDGKFSPDGLGFCVTNFYGSISFYGYGERDLFMTVPTEQFFSKEFTELEFNTQTFQVLSLETLQEMHFTENGQLCSANRKPYSEEQKDFEEVRAFNVEEFYKKSMKAFQKKKVQTKSKTETHTEACVKALKAKINDAIKQETVKSLRDMYAGIISCLDKVTELSNEEQKEFKYAHLNKEQVSEVLKTPEVIETENEEKLKSQMESQMQIELPTTESQEERVIDQPRRLIRQQAPERARGERERVLTRPSEMEIENENEFEGQRRRRRGLVRRAQIESESESEEEDYKEDEEYSHDAKSVESEKSASPQEEEIEKEQEQEVISKEKIQEEEKKVDMNTIEEEEIIIPKAAQKKNRKLILDDDEDELPPAPAPKIVEQEPPKDSMVEEKPVVEKRPILEEVKQIEEEEKKNHEAIPQQNSNSMAVEREEVILTRTLSRDILGRRNRQLANNRAVIPQRSLRGNRNRLFQVEEEEQKESQERTEEVLCVRCGLENARIQCNLGCGRFYHSGCSKKHGKESERKDFSCFTCLNNHRKRDKAIGSRVDRDWPNSDVPNSNVYLPQVGDYVTYVFQSHEDFVLQYFDFLRFSKGEIYPFEKEKSLCHENVCKITDIKYQFPLSAKWYKKRLNVLMKISLEIVEPETARGATFTFSYFKCEIHDILIPNEIFGRSVELIPNLRRDQQVRVHLPGGVKLCTFVEKSPREEGTFPTSPWKSLEFVCDSDNEESIAMRLRKDQTIVHASPWDIIWNEPFNYHKVDEGMNKVFAERMVKGIDLLHESNTDHYDIFLEEVDKVAYKNYPLTVAFEMNLEKIKRRLMNLFYRHKEAVIGDTYLIKYNCYKFNEPTSVISTWSTELTDKMTLLVDPNATPKPILQKEKKKPTNESRRRITTPFHDQVESLMNKPESPENPEDIKITRSRTRKLMTDAPESFKEERNEEKTIKSRLRRGRKDESVVYDDSESSLDHNWIEDEESPITLRTRSRRVQKPPVTTHVEPRESALQAKTRKRQEERISKKINPMLPFVVDEKSPVPKHSETKETRATRGNKTNFAQFFQDELAKDEMSTKRVNPAEVTVASGRRGTNGAQRAEQKPMGQPYPQMAPPQQNQIPQQQRPTQREQDLYRPQFSGSQVNSSMNRMNNPGIKPQTQQQSTFPPQQIHHPQNQNYQNYRPSPSYPFGQMPNPSMHMASNRMNMNPHSNPTGDYRPYEVGNYPYIGNNQGLQQQQPALSKPMPMYGQGQQQLRNPSMHDPRYQTMHSSSVPQQSQPQQQMPFSMDPLGQISFSPVHENEREFGVGQENEPTFWDTQLLNENSFGSLFNNEQKIDEPLFNFESEDDQHLFGNYQFMSEDTNFIQRNQGPNKNKKLKI